MAYATTTQLQTYLGGTLPSGAQRLLDNASALIDQYTLGRIDTTITAEANAAQLATCQQVEYWIAIGLDVAVTGFIYDSYSIGTFQATLNPNNAGVKLAPYAKATLFNAGLGFRGVRMI